MCLFKSDWYPVWVKNGYYACQDSWGDKYRENFSIEIQFSPKRNRYRIKCRGYDPKLSNVYIEAVQKLNQFINENETIKKS